MVDELPLVDHANGYVHLTDARTLVLSPADADELAERLHRHARYARYAEGHVFPAAEVEASHE